MGSLPNTAQHSDSPSQDGIENAQKELRSYEKKCAELSKLISQHPDALDKHKDLTKHAGKILKQTTDALEKARKLVEKYESRFIIRILNDELGIALSSELKKYEKLKRVIKENIDKVERLLQQINVIIKKQPEIVGGLVDFSMKKTTPFTEPYDEGLCEF